MAERRSISIAEVDRRWQLQKKVPKAGFAEVVASVEQNGLLHDPRIDASGTVITGGLQICAAAQAGKLTVDALVEDREFSEDEAIIAQLASDTQEISLKVSEKGQGFERWIELTQGTATEAAAKVGISSTSVTRLRASAGLEQPFRDLVDAGLGESKGYELAMMTSEQRMAILPQLQRGELTREELVAIRKSGTVVEPEKQSVSPAKVKVVLDDGRSVTVQAPELDMPGYIDAIRVLLRKAKQAHARGVALEDFARSARKPKRATTA